jgi:uncharacterized membrane protein
MAFNGISLFPERFYLVTDIHLILEKSILIAHILYISVPLYKMVVRKLVAMLHYKTSNVAMKYLNYKLFGK